MPWQNKLIFLKEKKKTNKPNKQKNLSTSLFKGNYSKQLILWYQHNCEIHHSLVRAYGNGALATSVDAVKEIILSLYNSQ